MKLLTDNEIALKSWEDACSLMHILLQAGYVAMMSREDDLIIINWVCTRQVSDRNGVVFMQREEFEDYDEENVKDICKEAGVEDYPSLMEWIERCHKNEQDIVSIALAAESSSLNTILDYIKAGKEAAHKKESSSLEKAADAFQKLAHTMGADNSIITSENEANEAADDDVKTEEPPSTPTDVAPQSDFM